MSNHYHPYHISDPSPWPVTGSIGALGLMTGSVMYFHNYQGGALFAGISLVYLLLVFTVWFRDVTREATFQGHHTIIVQRGLKLGMLLFILSEVLFFLSFFWAFFHSSLSPDVVLGSVWPPVGIQVLNPFEVPLLNTVILLSSGATVTWAHNAIIVGDRKGALLGLILTVVLGLVFTALQAMEYVEASFTIADSAYGTTFFVATGFHGLHVIIGTLILLVCLIRLIKNHYTRRHHFGLEAGILYWHFVDAVWLLLYTSIYWWGSLGA